MIIDAKGLLCPQPVILTKKTLESIDEGEVVVLVDNTTAKENISRLAHNLGYGISIEECAGVFSIKIVKGSNKSVKFSQKESIVIVVGTDKLGTGDDALGAVLMKSYTYALTETNPLPKAMLFLNSGAKLTVSDSPVLENIKKLSTLGVEIMTCGTCLDFFGIKDTLSVGVISNMYSIIETQFMATTVISLG